MATQLYSIEYKSQLPAELINSLLDPLPEPIQQKFAKYKRWQDAYGCLFGKHLLMIALRAAGHPFTLTDIQYTTRGKPYLRNGPGFNISHSGNRVVCALTDQSNIGIDIEEVKDIPIDDFNTQFTKQEWDMITRAREPGRAFYRYWTAKECILKADGAGLQLPMADLKIESDTRVFLNGIYWNILEITSFEDYACHIATQGSISYAELEVRKLIAADVLTLSS